MTGSTNLLNSERYMRKQCVLVQDAGLGAHLAQVLSEGHRVIKLSEFDFEEIAVDSVFLNTDYIDYRVQYTLDWLSERKIDYAMINGNAAIANLYDEFTWTQLIRPTYVSEIEDLYFIREVELFGEDTCYWRKMLFSCLPKLERVIQRDRENNTIIHSSDSAANNI